MRNIGIEGGVYLLLFFTPLAFGGVEMWATGVLQIVAGLVFAAWLWGVIGNGSPSRTAIWKRYPSLWVPIGLFILLVVVQLVPLPGDMVKSLSPATYGLYEETLPGYAQGEPFAAGSLSPWLLDRSEDRIPEELASDQPLPELEESAYPVKSSPRRTLSIYPHLTKLHLNLFLCLLALFIVVADHFRDRKRLNRLLAAAVFSGFVVSFLGIVQKLTWNEKLYWMREGTYKNVFGPFVNRNNYAAFAGFLLPLAICLSLGALRKVRSGESDAVPRLLFNSFAAVVIGGGIFYSLSRGGMAAAGVSTLLVAGFLVYYGRHGIELALLGLLLVFAAGFLIWLGPEAVVERVGTISEAPSTPSLALRINAWNHALEMIGKHPLVGAGFGTFTFSFPRYAPPGRAWWTTAHNEYIELAADTGITGALLLLAGLGAFIRLALKPALFRGKETHYAYAGLVAGIVAVSFHSALSSNFQIPANGVMLVVLGGGLLNLVSIQRRQSRPASRTNRRPRTARAEAS